MVFQGRLNVSVRPTDSVRPSDRFCPSVRQMSLRPTDLPLVYAMGFGLGFATGFAMGFAMGFLYLPPPKDEGKAPEGGYFASYVPEENMYSKTSKNSFDKDLSQTFFFSLSLTQNLQKEICFHTNFKKASFPSYENTPKAKTWKKWFYG